MIKRKPMQVVVEKIARLSGRKDEYDKALSDGNGFHIRALVDGYMPLVIEVLPNKEVSVAHYFTQNGDAMRDPEIVFESSMWMPIEVTMDPVGLYQRAEKGRYLSGLITLARTWASNLRDQGFLDAETVSFPSEKRIND